ncbi:MAG: Mrp/NBP35 family ATP-binding protein [bacterium]|nr:Mrp/NBP35 family ATP-binding protein [bacterium]
MNDSANNQKISNNLDHIKNRLLVFSGKGGVGKSTVATNLAVALSRRGKKVGLLDADIHGPNLAKMLGVEDKIVGRSDEQIFPVEVTENLKVISISFFLESPDTPVIWRGPLKMKLIEQFLGDTQWGELDWLICDSPPGTGDEPLTVAQLIPATGAIIVTTPQDVSLLDSRKAVSFSRQLELDIFGIVENMSVLTCPHCGEAIDLFKKDGGKKIADELNLPLLGRIPIDPGIVRSGDSGRPFMLEDNATPASEAFNSIVDNIINR